VFQIADFSSVNDLKFIYVHLQFQNLFPGYNPWTPVIKGWEWGKRGDGRKGREGMGWDEPPKTNPVHGPEIRSPYHDPDRMQYTYHEAIWFPVSCLLI
jgi:hypothetical protein